MSLHWSIIRRCLRDPFGVAAVDDRRVWKRAEVMVGGCHVADEVERLTGHRHVAVMLPTCGAFGMVALGIWMAGRVVVPLNYLLTREELEFLVEDSGCEVVLSTQVMMDYVGLGEDERLGGARVVRVEDLSLGGVPDPRLPAMAGDDDLAVILYTSGTSGLPKGVMLTHGNIGSNVRQCVEHAGRDVWEGMLGVLPQFHSFGLTVLTVLPLVIGSKVVYTARFVPRKIVELLREHRPHVFVGIPSMYAALARVKDAGPGDFRCLEMAVSGGEPLPDDVCRRFRERFGIRISEGYGLTETSPVTNVRLPGEDVERTVGRALPGVEQLIVGVEGGEAGRVLGPGREGEIRMRGPNVMRGYYRRAEETEGAFDEAGRFRTGDMGTLDAEGFLRITGRIKEMMIVGGENVFPREIEEVLNKHPSVRASGVVGRVDDVRGEVPVAFVEVEEGEGFDADSVKGWCRERLAGYKVPRELVVVDELPRSGTGKVMRRKLMERVEAEAGA